MMPPKDIAAPHKRRPFDVDALVIALEGEFDIAERVRLLDAFAVTTSSPLVVIDFEKTRYIRFNGAGVSRRFGTRDFGAWRAAYLGCTAASNPKNRRCLRSRPALRHS